MKIKYDPIADAIYISLVDGKSAKTSEVADDVLVDLNTAGEVIGIEILFAAQRGIDVNSITMEQSLPANYRRTLLEAQKDKNTQQ